MATYCIHCQKDISDKKEKRTKFCSLSCAAKHNNKGKKPLAIKTSVCTECRCEFIVKRKDSNPKFCSCKCFGKNRSRISHLNFLQLVESGGGSTKKCKQYLIEKFGESCMACGQSNIWNDLPLVMQLDHIDGNSDNNKPSNTRLLCPNCHTQTDTFGKKSDAPKKQARRNVRRRTIYSTPITSIPVD